MSGDFGGINKEINRIKSNVDDALAATAEMGASVPATANSNDLGTLIRSIPKVNVVQTTGDSTTDVMSQAAVTNALDFYVNMVDAESPDGETVVVECDKSFMEVGEALAVGRSVYARYTPTDGGMLTLPLLMVQGDGVVIFLAFTGSETMAFAMGAEMGNYAVMIPFDMKENLGLAPVATSGNYNDLSNKPTIPAAYTHPSSHPASMITGLATVATSGSYNDLSNKPTIPAAYSHPSTHPASMITGLATVATSGSYNDLTNKPTIPAAVTVDSALSSSSTNPVQNKVVNSALAGKAPSYTYGTTDLTAGSSSLTTGVLYFVYE